jgi:hypothetical protein
MDTLIFPCLCCLVIGALGGFAFGFRVAAMLRLRQQDAAAPAADLVEDFA